MIKAMKKLKIWSKRKKKKKTHILYQPLSPPHTSSTTTGHCCCSCSATQPSAPPLPPWIEFEQTQETAPLPPWIEFEQTQETVSVYGSFPVFSLDTPPPISEPDEFSSSTSSLQTASSEFTPLYNASSPVKSVSNQSYQQYMIPTPVYDIPPPIVMTSTETERPVAGILGCVGSVGSHLIHCFCPCFQFHKSYS